MTADTVFYTYIEQMKQTNKQVGYIKTDTDCIAKPDPHIVIFH